MRQDLYQALRALRTSPGFTAVAVVSLALGIGANTAIFTLIDSVILKPLPVSRPEQLLHVTLETPQFFSNVVWEQLRDRQDVFSGIFAYGRWAFNLANGGEVRNVAGQYVSGQYFDTLGVHAALGRLLTTADDRRGCPGIAVLSYGFWQREYGGRTNIVGITLSIARHPFEIVGVAQPGFTGVEVGGPADIFAPLCTEGIDDSDRSLLDQSFLPGWLQIVGRPKPGLPATQIAARLKTLAPAVFRASIVPDMPPDEQAEFVKHTLHIESAASGLSYIRRRYRQALMILMAIVAAVLLIACANVANLLLARSTSREREIAIRLALGCGRARLIRQLLTESLLLSLAGAALGIVLAKWSARLLVVFLHADLDLTLDARVLAFTAAVAILTGLLFGTAPAWRGTSVDPQTAMRANTRGIIEGSRFGLGKALVVSQLALSVLLVVGAGLMLSTFWKLATLDPGFDRDNVLLATVDLRNRPAALPQVLAKLRDLPGVRSAGAAAITPMCGCRTWVNLSIEGYTPKSPGDGTVTSNRVSDRYFETLGTPIIAGRDFNLHDTASTPQVALINQTMARKYFGAANPIGKHFRYVEGTTLSDPVEIIGIVKDAKQGTIREEILPSIYASWNQHPQEITYFDIRAAAGSAAQLIAPVKSAIAAIDPIASLQFTTLATRVDDLLARERLLAALSAIFGSLALLLAAIGLYGIMSYNVARRRHEIGIRMALGAERTRVLQMIMREVVWLIAIGLAAGLGLAMLTTRFVASFLYGLAPKDPLTFVTAAAILAAIGAAAGYFPACRAARLDPMAALREE